ncbi:hypothetical protein D6850_11120 [Roseovarius spongiae]|uniref:Uncharacterized protein n=1 Tax=Roseovarius spongiae TaxID=2320272 RepID=A0A3A8AUK9_9RHOB|nr:hypothetical protein [Roseovarius spongiae]RKF15359.1 hypothetical protein D6850_11120 [Roseovarius spongiae]
MNGFAIAFAAIAAATAIGVDYMAQAQAADEPLGSYSVAAYSQTVSDRVGGLLKTAEPAPPVPARDYLPDAPPGWERRAWSPVDESGDDPIKTESMADMDDSTVMRAAEGVMSGKEIARAERDVWEYVGPSGTIRLSATHEDSIGRSFTRKLKSDPGTINVMLRHGRPIKFGKVAGVTFYGAKRDEWDSSGTLPLTPPIFVRGHVGNDIEITAYAEGNHDTLIDLLAAIDYDALNEMQATPARRVGSAQGPLSAAQRKTMLVRAGQLENARVKARRALEKAAEAEAPAKQEPKAANRLEMQAKHALNRGADDPKRLKVGGEDCDTQRVGKFCGVK